MGKLLDKLRRVQAGGRPFCTMIVPAAGMRLTWTSRTLMKTLTRQTGVSPALSAAGIGTCVNRQTIPSAGLKTACGSAGCTRSGSAGITG